MPRSTTTLVLSYGTAQYIVSFIIFSVALPLVFHPRLGTKTWFTSNRLPKNDARRLIFQYLSGRVWNPATGNCEAVLGGHGGTVGALCSISWSPPGEANKKNEINQGALIVSGSGDSTVRVWGRAGGVGELGEWVCRAVLEGHRYVCVCGGVFLRASGHMAIKTVKYLFPRCLSLCAKCHVRFASTYLYGQQTAGRGPSGRVS